MAFSTLAHAALLPVIVVWIFKRDTVAREGSVRPSGMPVDLRTVIQLRLHRVRHAGADPAAVLLVRFPEGLSAGHR
jgi:hypothetical protein